MDPRLGMFGNDSPYISKIFLAGKSVLITGHTGFNGSSLSLWLTRLGAHVTGITLAPVSSATLFSSLSPNSIAETHF